MLNYPVFRLLRRLFCRHRSVTFVRNIYGAEIEFSGGMRSRWKCDRCGAVKWRRELQGW